MARHLQRRVRGEIATAFPAILTQEVLYIGYFMIIILAYTMAIPESYYDAAQLDGANVLQQERYITLPVIKPILITTMTLATAFALRHFITLIRTTIGRRDAASDSSQ